MPTRTGMRPCLTGAAEDRLWGKGWGPDRTDPDQGRAEEGMCNRGAACGIVVDRRCGPPAGGIGRFGKCNGGNLACAAQNAGGGTYDGLGAIQVIDRRPAQGPPARQRRRAGPSYPPGPRNRKVGGSKPSRDVICGPRRRGGRNGRPTWATFSPCNRASPSSRAPCTCCRTS